MSTIQIINNFKNLSWSHWIVMKIASLFCKHREKLFRKQTHFWLQHRLSNFKTIAIMNRFLLFLQRWFAFILLYNFIHIIENHMWLLIEMQNAKKLYRLRRIERNVFANIFVCDLTQIWQKHDLSSLKTIAIMSRFLLFLRRWIALILFYNLN